ncbi:MAG: nitrate/nitrite transporter NrtS [Bermanella sp.]
MLCKQLIIRALMVSFVVGSILLIINQYDALFGGNELRIVPAVLTYCVPFMVFIAGKVSGGREKS